jgi:hypothetical protein
LLPVEVETLKGNRTKGRAEVERCYKALPSGTGPSPRSPPGKLPRFRRRGEADLPMPTKRQIEYAEYLQTAHWKEISAKVKERAGNRCQVCNSDRALEAHHRTYENIFHELEHLSDLTCLCGRCHGLFHGRNAPQKAQSRKKPSRRRPSSTRKHRKFFARAEAKLGTDREILVGLGRAEVKRLLLVRQQQRDEKRAAKKALRQARKQAARAVLPPDFSLLHAASPVYPVALASHPDRLATQSSNQKRKSTL